MLLAQTLCLLASLLGKGDILRCTSRLLKKGHLLRFPHPSSLRRTAKYASLLRISRALHLALFEQPGKDDFFSSLLALNRMRLKFVSSTRFGYNSINIKQLTLIKLFS